MTHTQTRRLLPAGMMLGLWLAVMASPAGAQQAVLGQDAVLERESWARPPAVVERAVLAPRHENVTLSNQSPNGRYFLTQESDGLPSMAEFAKPHIWLGGLQVDPRANRARTFTTRGAAGLTVMEWETGRTIRIQVPAGSKLSGAQWSPDGSKLAYFASFEDVTHIHVADLPSGRSRQVTRTPVLATLNTSFDWTPDGRGIVAVLVPSNRGRAPAVPAVPTGPQVRLTGEGENRLRTYFSLLEWPHEQALLEYYTTGQLAIIDVASRTERRVGAPAMIRSVESGPAGEYLRVTTMQRPFSYVVPVSNFGGREELWSADGRVVATLSERPLNEGLRQQGGGDGPPQAQDTSAMRSIAWRVDGAGLSFLEQEPAPATADTAAGAAADTAQADRPRAARRKDRVMLWAPPFTDATKTVVYENDARMSSVRYSPDGQVLFITEGTGASQHLFAVRLSEPTKKHTILRGRVTAQAAGGAASDDDFYSNPGTLMTVRVPVGGSAVRLSGDGSSVYLSGTQYFRDPHSEAPREFIDRLELATGEKQRIYEGDNNGVSERIVAVQDTDPVRLVVVRESPTQVPDSYLREADGSLRKLTSNRDFTPEITRAQRRQFTVRRADGSTFRVAVTLPEGHRAGERLPAMFWFYPREFTDQEGYDRTLRTYNANRFPATGARSMEYLTLLGYAVVQPDAPIFGEQGRMNDNYVHDLRNNLAAVIDHLDREGIIDRDRLGIGGHSYGAFSAVNAMVHTPFFKAGIAGDGAYNRTLTPLGFQSERRDFWQARETYLGMSPFLYANNLTGALLMYHGIDDQNVGTHPINSVRLFHALNGLGKTASLYMYPYEDHGPATLETTLDLWARWVAWLDLHVKNGGRDRPVAATN
jgi:dipeptidyl aminopeptidase/acylaminoacyl peptidase